MALRVATTREDAHVNLCFQQEAACNVLRPVASQALLRMSLCPRETTIDMDFSDNEPYALIKKVKVGI